MMDNKLHQSIAIENVLQFKMRGRVAYQGAVSSNLALNFSYSKPFNDPTGKGYQRPINKQRTKDFAKFLSSGEDSLFTPILLNAGGHWDFQAYDKIRPNVGRLICKKKASLMDGQHRLGGIGVYTKETSAMLNVPFLAFHCLDEDEEIKFFDIINTKAKGIGSSLSRYLKRNNDKLSWIATQLIINPDSPFYTIGTLIGKRNKEKHITLQNIHNFLKLLTKKSDLAELPKEKILYIALYYFNEIKNILPNQWNDYKKYRLTHIVCLNALSIAGNTIISENYNFKSNHLNNSEITKSLTNIQNIDWSSEGSLKYLKGVSGSNLLASDLITSFKN